MITLITALVHFHLVSSSAALCGANVRWSHHFDLEEVLGMWYGVAYAKHSPDVTDRPQEIGCVTLHIRDADDDNDQWLDWTIPRRNYSDHKWVSHRNNPFSDTRVAGSWLDVRLKRRAKRNTEVKRAKREFYDGFRANRDEKRRLRVIWDEDGQSMEQTYVYSPDSPGLWTVEQWRPMEKELTSRGIDVWYPDDPPRHPDVIRILRVSPQELVINHCSDLGTGGVFTLILRRYPTGFNYWEWYDYQKEFYSYDLPNIYRKATVCAACEPAVSMISVFIICGVVLKLIL